MYGETLLHRAVAHQDVDLVRNIIKAGGNVNAKDYAGKLRERGGGRERGRGRERGKGRDWGRRREAEREGGGE